MIRTEERDGVRILRMEFGSANALGPDGATALMAAFEENRWPTVLTGEGEIFSAGLNLVQLHSLGRDEFEAFVHQFTILMTQALTARYPLIAAVNGHAVAGGCVLAMATDYRVGTVGPYKVGMNEMAIGLTLPAVVTEILRGKLLPVHARDVILGGALYDPDAAREVGLLDEVAADAEAAVERACTVAREFGRTHHEFAVMKGSLVAPITERLQQTCVALDRRFIDSWFGSASTRMREDTIARLQRPKD